MNDEKLESTRFLAQFELSKRSVAGWPNWMRDSAKMASATFPEHKIEQVRDNLKVAPTRKR